MRAESSDRSEIVSQVLFGEHFEVLEQKAQWTRIKLQYDGYEGWIDTKQFQPISAADFAQLSDDPIILNGDLIEYVSSQNDFLMPIPIGASLSFLNHGDINKQAFDFEGLKTSGQKPKSEIISTAFLYM